MVLPLAVSASSKIIMGHQLIDDRWNSTSAVIILAEIFAGQLQVHEQRDVEPIFLAIVDANAKVAREPLP